MNVGILLPADRRVDGKINVLQEMIFNHRLAYEIGRRDFVLFGNEMIDLSKILPVVGGFAGRLSERIGALSKVVWQGDGQVQVIERHRA